MVDHVAGDDARRRLRTVLVGVVAKVGERRVRAAHQGLREAFELVADRAEELVYTTAQELAGTPARVLA
jgi:hypothetical protein